MINHHHRPVAAIGPVNIMTGKCIGSDPMFANVWECWEEGRGTNMLLRSEATGSAYIVHTAGDEGNKVGEVFTICHDQSRRVIGTFKVIAVQPHTKSGLAAFKSAMELVFPGRSKSVKMATYK